MYKYSSLVPSRFLILIAHFAICINLLWNNGESLNSCSLGSQHESDHNSHHPHTKLKIGLKFAVGFMCIEFIAFIFGFTMFNITSAILSICGHTISCLAMSLLIEDRWQCGWFWWIFTVGSVFPITYDIYWVIYVLIRRKW